jgi:hypothetical protein
MKLEKNSLYLDKNNEIWTLKDIQRTTSILAKSVVGVEFIFARGTTLKKVRASEVSELFTPIRAPRYAELVLRLNQRI